MKDVHAFSDDQKAFLKSLMSDFQGPTSTGSLLYILASALDEVRPKWRSEPIFSDAQLQADIEVCGVALQYLEIKSVVDED